MLREVDETVWAPPSAPWVMHQTWQNLLFAHWPVNPQQISPLLPSGLPLDTFGGMAWIGVVPFTMSDVAPRFVPGIPGLSQFPEINVRTYVVRDGKPGVYFFSLDAGNAIAVSIARNIFHLPYFNAQFTVKSQKESIHYASHRTHAHAGGGDFVGTYQPIGPVFRSEAGTLAHWLTERYCLYTTDRQQRLLRGEIRHRHWPLQPATAHITEQTLTEAAGITLPTSDPILHFAQRLDVAIWWLAEVDR